ncbi:MAG: N-6 DNA methylase [Candidatus Latescibacter sp.]|nr:N-6 DNA methylase [Candidatus Latescibacter sp.]
MPDAVIFESQRSNKVVCVIEAKPPQWDVFNEMELKEPARQKAVSRKAPYFALTNFKKLVWYNTQKVNEQRPEEEQIIHIFTLSELESMDDIERTRYSEPIKKKLEEFLIKLSNVYSGKEHEPKLAIDELLVYRIQEKISVLTRYYRGIIEDQCHKDAAFAKQLKKWFLDQGWSFAWQPQDFDKAARQTAYLLVNKILFYDLLHAKRPKDLDPLNIPKYTSKGSLLKSILQGYFNLVLDIDYETIYTADFIDSLAFPNSEEVVQEIGEFTKLLSRYDFSKLGYDVIGRIFERLIPQSERHHMGQYFTNSDIVDIILVFCMLHEDDTVLDPSCGAGTFLVRAYQHKKLMNPRLTHEEILDKLWGNDIAKFPAHLATINLAIKDLGVNTNYPNILQEDFFAVHVGEEGFDPDTWRKKRARTLGKDEREIVYPRWFNCIVGNPPYTRQEEMSEISPQDSDYKESLIKKAVMDLKGENKLAEIGKRAGIHAYFFVHGAKLLLDGGYFGFIVSNSWLDVDYGKGLQEFFLNTYKIVAIIESKVERWFEDADINTGIIILQKCGNKTARDENLARFVYLKKPLRELIPPAQDVWEKQVDRLNEIDKLKRMILYHSGFYENEDLRISPILQKELWEEGFDPNENKYVGSKWGKYLRAPEIYFTILKKGKDILVPLKEIASVRFGIKTGANEFFYLTEEEIKRKRIEKEYWMHQDEAGKWIPNYLIKSPRECKSIIINPEDLKFRVLMIHKDRADLKNTHILRYIKTGERSGFNQRTTCAGRERWYELGEWDPEGFLHPMVHNDRQLITLNDNKFYVDHNLFEIRPEQNEWIKPLSLFFISTLSILIKEIGGRTNLGEGALKTEGIDIEKFLALNMRDIKPEIIDKLNCWLIKNPNYEHISCFIELGADSIEEVSLDKVNPDRRELDKIIMGDILGLTEAEQLEVYRAVVDLVKSRIDKAKSLQNGNKTKEGIDISSFINTVLEKLGEKTMGKFYEEKILGMDTLKTVTLLKNTKTSEIRNGLFGYELKSGKDYISCGSEDEARYLQVFLDIGLDEVKIPENVEYLKALLPEIEALKRSHDEIIDSYLESIVSTKTRDKLRHLLWAEIMKL